MSTALNSPEDTPLLARLYRPDSELTPDELKAWADAEQALIDEEALTRQAIADYMKPSLPGEFAQTGAPPVSPSYMYHPDNPFGRLPLDHPVHAEEARVEAALKAGKRSSATTDINQMMARAATTAYAKLFK